MRAADGFDLFDNPFVKLGLTPRDTAEATLEAAQNLLTRRPEQEAEILDARRRLMASRARLRAELRMLSDCAPARAKLILQSLRQGLLPPDLAQLGVLTQANAAAHICAAGEAAGGASALHLLIRLQGDLDVAAITEMLNQNRAVAGFPALSPRLVGEELHQLQQEHVGAAYARLRRLQDAAADLAAMVDALPHAAGRPSGTGAEHFLHKLAERYRAGYAAELSAAERSVRRKLDLVLRGEGSVLEDLLEELPRFSRRLTPLQKLDARRQLDEPASRRVAEDIRAAVPALFARDMESALRLMDALASAFALLPDFTALLHALREELLGAQQAQARAAAAQALAATLAAVRRDWPAFLQSLRGGHFRVAGPGLAGMLAQQLQNLAALTPQDPGPWLALSALADEALAQPQGVPAARAILRGLLALHAPPAPPAAQDALRSLGIRVEQQHLEPLARQLTPDIVTRPELQARAAAPARRTAAAPTGLAAVFGLSGDAARLFEKALPVIAAGLGIVLGIVFLRVL